MKIIVLFIISQLILSCSGERVLKKHESGRDFNVTAENREASVALESGGTLAVENMYYKKGIFYFGKDRNDSLSFENVNSICFDNANRGATGMKYAFAVFAGLWVGTVVTTGISADVSGSGFIILGAVIGLIGSPIGYIIGYSTGENIRYEMKHRK